jgi:RNA polymerase sigma-70 factor (ECF subfamily)
MKRNPAIDQALVKRIRSGDADAWSDLINHYEGRLLAYVNRRLSNRSASEDIVQEAFVGFLNSLPNFDGRRSLDSYLFSICAYKMTDHLRRQGRRPAIPMSVGEDSSGGQWQLQGEARPASSIARSGERQRIEHQALAEALQQQVQHWQQKNDWLKLKCIELLMVRGSSNKDVAAKLEISEQKVASFKFDFLNRIRLLVKRQGLNEEVFPELYR